MGHAFQVNSRDRNCALKSLRENGWLSTTPGDFQDAVLGMCRLKTIERDEVLYTIGEAAEGPASGLWGVVSGGLAIEIAPAERGPTLAYVAKPGFWIGVNAMLTRRPRTISATATRPTMLVNLPLRKFEQIAERTPLAWRWLAHLMVDHLQLSQGALDDLMIRNPHQRVVAILLRLAGCRTTAMFAGSTPEVDVSQEHLAGMANLSRSSVGNIVRNLDARSLVSVSYRRISILDPESLARELESEKHFRHPRTTADWSNATQCAAA